MEPNPVSTRYFIDTEFIENGSTIELLSIGIVADSPATQVYGRELYLQNASADFKGAGDWVWRNVFPHMEHFSMKGERSCRQSPHPNGPMDWKVTWCRATKPPCPWRTHAEIRDLVKQFCNPEEHGKPEFWGYFADYDWVAFCQLFGSMVDLPKGYPMYCRDIKQWADQLGDIRIPKPEKEVHHALVDARWAQYAYHYLTEHSITKNL
jgi:hypothetical protein